MPLAASTFFLPASASVPFILMDLHLRGGFKVYVDEAERDGSHPFSRKAGMLIYVQSLKQYQTLEEDMSTWTEFTTGGGGLSAEGLVEPLYIDDDGKLAIQPHRILPQEVRRAGYVLTSTGPNTFAWQEPPATVGKRATAKFEAPSSIAGGESIDFELELGKSILIVSMELSSPDLQIEGFSNSNRDDNNPYTFVSFTGQLVDEGIKDRNGEQSFLRRYAFLANQDSVVSNKHYFTLTNKSALDLTPTVTLTYVVLE